MYLSELSKNIPAPAKCFHRAFIHIPVGTKEAMLEGNEFDNGLVGFHRSVSGAGWTVTHIPTGGAIADKVKDARNALNLCRELAGLVPDAGRLGEKLQLPDELKAQLRGIIDKYPKAQ